MTLFYIFACRNEIIFYCSFETLTMAQLIRMSLIQMRCFKARHKLTMNILRNDLLEIKVTV